MTKPTFRNLTLDELLGRGWLVSDSLRAESGVWLVTLILPGGDGTITHAVTGEGETANAAREKAVEIANVWRAVKAAERSQEGE